jgi:hypothetical protein
MRAFAAAAFAVLALVAAGCGGCGDDDKPAPKTVAGVTGTTRVENPATVAAVAAFRRHANAAVTALREGVEAPFKAGVFDSGDPLKIISALSKAGTSLQTAVRELTAAVKVASGPNGVPDLAAQAQSLLGHIPDLLKSAQGGQLDTNALSGFLNDLDALGKSASAAGIDVPSTGAATTPGTTPPATTSAQ